MSKAAPLSFDFALEGFRIIRERPKLIAFWGALCLLGNGLIHILMVQMAGHSLVSLVNMRDADPKSVDPNLMMAVMQSLLPALGVYVLISMVTTAILSGAVFRASMGDEKDGFGFLKFGRNEINLIIVSLATLLVMFGVALSSCTVAVILGSILSAGSQAVLSMLVEISLFFAILAMLYMQVRLSLNMAQTFATGKLNVFGSFALTREPFWPLVTGYALSFALALLVAFLAQTVINAVLVLGFKSQPDELAFMSSMGSFETFLTPANIVFIIMSGGLIAPLLSAIIIAAPMAAYKALGGEGVALKAESAA